VEAILHSQALSVFIGMVLTAIGGYIVVVVNNKKIVSERRMTTQALTTEREVRQADLESQLKVIRLEGEIAEVRRQEAARIDSERLRLEAVQAAAVVANVLAQKTEEDRLALAAQNKMLHEIAVVQDKTHEAVNSSRTALETVVQDVRNQLSASEQALKTLEQRAAAELQALRDLHARDLAIKDAKIDALTQQLATMVPAVLLSPTPGPIPVHETPLPPEPPHIVQP
jgi:hypothetical protein